MRGALGAGPVHATDPAAGDREGRPATSEGAGAPRPVLGDRYELLEELGRGGMGVVYRAHDRTLGRDVALKVLQVAGRVDFETIERFQRETRAAAALDHPNIVRVHDVGALPDGAPYSRVSPFFEAPERDDRPGFSSDVTYPATTGRDTRSRSRRPAPRGTRFR